MDYEDFLKQNRVRVNHVLNKAVLCCVLAGIGIAIGTALHLWSDISYASCIIQVVLVLVASLIMYLVNKKYSETYIPSIIGLFALDLVLMYSANVHIGIYISYFLIPLLAIAFCSKGFFLAMCGMNYGVMFVTVFMVSHYYGPMTSETNTAANPALSWFIGHMTGYTLETIVMCICGYFICNLITTHLKSLYDYKSQTERQLKVMGAATRIFDEIYYINDITDTYVVTHGKEMVHITRNEVENSINHLLENVVSTDESRFKDFVDLRTARQRLENKESIEDTFYSTEYGYFNAMFITVPKDADSNFEEYIFCIRDINEEKVRERTLNEMARRDQPTSLYNRRAYEEDFATCEKEGEDVSLLVADINGLKMVNDTLGHLAGDELILAAARFLNKYFEEIGRVYRFGGDEFYIIIKDGQVDKVQEQINVMREAMKAWKGKKGNALTISVGFASMKKDADNLKAVEKLADQRMYKDKDDFYKSNPQLLRRTV